MTITEFVEALRERLVASFRVAGRTIEGLAYRADETGEARHEPTVYPFSVPTADLSDGMPKKTPCVVITVPECVSVEKTEVTFRVRLALCVGYAGIAPDEYVERIGANEYAETEEKPNSDAALELCKTSILFTDQILRKLRKMRDLSMKEFNVEMCAADIPDYPFAVSAISFDTSITDDDFLTDLY